MGVYNVHAGHCPYKKGASGAVSILNESVEDRLVKNEVIRLLREKGNTVYDCTVDYKTTASGCLQGIVKMCNAHKVLIDMSIHLNSGRGDLKGDKKTGGVEVYLFPNASPAMVAIANNICANISRELGIRNRGVKYRKDLYVLRRTNSPAMLIECCFVDDLDDYEHWDYKKCAKAIVEGTLGTKVSTGTEQNKKPVSHEAELLEVDGYWGKSTTYVLQSILNAPYKDSIISSQNLANKGYLKACRGGWMFNDPHKEKIKGSKTIELLQKRIGMPVSECDGIAGKQTVANLQQYLRNKNYDIVVDGYCGLETVKALQKRLNVVLKQK